MIPPEPQLTALLEVIYLASLRARQLGYGGKALSGESHVSALLEVSDLMDAIHNIPLYLTTYENWNEQHFRSAFLEDYDQKWSATSGLSLSAVYQDAISGKSSSVENTRAHFRESRKSGET